MNAAATASAAGGAQALPAILWAGLVCGTMDITAALTVYGHYGLMPMRLLQGIAAGLLGPRSYEGGTATAALGLFCHYFIAYSAATVYFAASRGMPILVRHFIGFGALYGVAVYFFMQLVVLPLSNATRRPFSIKMTVIGVVIHIFCVGLPIATMVRRFSAS
jgi:uncharacterized membrane protein YagU involved in acid resistance